MTTKECPECKKQTFKLVEVHLDGKRPTWVCKTCEYEEPDQVETPEIQRYVREDIADHDSDTS